MSSTTAVPLEALIEDALNQLHSHSQRPTQTTVGGNALDDAVDTTLTVADQTNVISNPSILEAGQELLLVTGKTADTAPVFTVIRGYAGTPKNAGWPTGSPLLIEPAWSRWRVRNAVVRCFQRCLNAKLPQLVTAQLDPLTSSSLVVEMPANTVDVNRVFIQNSRTGTPEEVNSWDFFDDVSAASSTAKLLTLSPQAAGCARSFGTLYVTYQTPYGWSGLDPADPAEADTISIPLGAEELPGLYAAAFLLAGREVSRIQLDRTEEWPNETAMRNGVTLRAVQQAWSAFYAALDEARSLQNVPRRFRFRPRRNL